jgi:AmpE protein
MSITLVAVVIALVLGHVAPQTVAAVRRFGWYGRWLQWLDAHAESSVWRGRFGLLLALAPPLLLVGLVQWSLDAHLLGLLSLLFGVAVLVYAWGPRDLDLDVEAVIDAPDPASRRQAIAALWPPGEAVVADGPALVEAVFGNALARWFGVLFWFLLLGPFGAVLYRLTALAAASGHSALLPERTLHGARHFKRLLDWPVAQLVTLSMALVADFDTVFGAWRGAGGDALRLDVSFLGAAARASVRSELAEEAREYAEEGLVQVMAELPELRDAMSLVWRVLLLWLAALALFVIAGWVS